MRPAASAWEEHYAANLKNKGHERGRAAPTAFTNKWRRLNVPREGEVPLGDRGEDG